VLHELVPDALGDERQTTDHDYQADDADQQPPASVTHDRGGKILLLTSLARCFARDHLDRQVGEAGVHQCPAQRLQSGTRSIGFTGDAKCGFTKPPDCVSREPDAEQPE
jgi:hypothetical protein